MNLLVAENISKNYTEKILFDSISFGIEDSDKIGLIGVNGTGKSTLLRIISGDEVADNGEIIRRKGIEIHYLSQDPTFDSDITVIKQIFKGDIPVLKVIQEYEEVLEMLKITPDDEELQKKFDELNLKMNGMNAWQLESEAKKVLNKLGINNFNAKMGKLSGGQRKRVFLAQALIRPADLLILDEPTNHLDNETISWLEDYLKSRKGALLMITHDRYFLDRVVNEIMELHKGSLYRYKGNYSLYLEKKAEREQVLIGAEKKRRSMFKKELEWIRTGAKARTTKQKARIDRFEQLKEGKIDISEDQNLDIAVGSRRLGKKIIEIKNISKSFNNEDYIRSFEYNVIKHDRIGIVGPNGTGKSTLLNIIAGVIEPDSGEVEIGETVKIGYYSQGNESMDGSQRVIEYIKDEAEMITTSDGQYITASQMLERFLFPPDIQYTYIDKLSGGERRRLYLLKVLMSNPNVLLLDEPTNDLDIQTLTILEEYIEAFSGIVISVSHDRYFLDKVTDKIFAFEGNGVVKQYTGNYFDYCESMKNIKDKNDSKNNGESKNEGTNIGDKVSQDKKKNKPIVKLSYKDQRDYEQIEDKISEVELQIEDIDEKISNAGSDFVKLQKLLNNKEELEVKLEELMERWEYLNELVEEIERNKNK